MAEPVLTVPPPRSIPVDQRDSGLPLAHLLPGPVHYVLAGGGAHGCVQWGLLQALSETDVTPDSLIGTSAGALTGAIYAEDPRAGVNRLAYVWSQLDLQSLVGDGWFGLLRSATTGNDSIVGNQALQHALESILVARDFDELSLPFAAVATDLASGLAKAFDQGSLIPSLLASAAIPGVLPPVTIDGRRFVDGLASANLPAQLAVMRGAGSIVVLDTGSRSPSKPGTSAAKVVARVTQVLTAAQRSAQLAFAGRHVPVLLLPTPQNLGGTLDFSGTSAAAAQSYELGRRYLSDLAAGHDSQLKPGLYTGMDFLDQDPEINGVLQVVGG